MIKDLVPVKFIPKIRRLGYIGCPTFYKVSKWFRKELRYTSWIEQSEDTYIYKIYSMGSFRRPKGYDLKYPHCKTYEQAEKELIRELIKIAEED